LHYSFFYVPEHVLRETDISGVGATLDFLQTVEQLVDSFAHDISLLFGKDLPSRADIADEERPFARHVLLGQLHYLYTLCQLSNQVLLLRRLSKCSVRTLQLLLKEGQVARFFLRAIEILFVLLLGSCFGQQVFLSFISV